MSMASGLSGPRAISSKFHHVGNTQRLLLQNFERFGGIGDVHDEDDAVPLGLKEPLLDLPSEMVANSGAYLEGQDGRDRIGRSLGCHRTDR